MKTKREMSLSPSSSWRENPQPRHRTTSTGCFPGFFHLLFSKFNRRKSLTLGSRKQERRIDARVQRKEPRVEDDGAGAGDPSRASKLDVHGFQAPPLSEAETRTKLIGALEKCDRDLEALQKTIDAIRNTFLLHHKLSSQAHVVHDFRRTKTGEAQNQQNPRPKLQPLPPLEGAREETATRQGKKNDFDIHISVANHIDKPASPTTRSISREMIESVSEACRDIEWGEKREVGKVGLSLQDSICKDLIEETVRELSGSRALVRRRLPSGACRRRLSF